MLHGAIAAILAILAEGFAENNLGDSEVLTLFLAVVAFGYIATKGDYEEYGEYQESPTIPLNSGCRRQPCVPGTPS